MKFNISVDDAKFIVNENKKIVVCIIEETSNLFRHFAISNLHIRPDCDERIWGPSRLYSMLEMPNKFVGVAKCSDDDEWNEELGKLIAFSRAKDNLLKSFVKCANTFFNYIYKNVNEDYNVVDSLIHKLMENTDHRHNYIDELLGPEEE